MITRDQLLIEVRQLAADSYAVDQATVPPCTSAFAYGVSLQGVARSITRAQDQYALPAICRPLPVGAYLPWLPLGRADGGLHDTYMTHLHVPDARTRWITLWRDRMPGQVDTWCVRGVSADLSDLAADSLIGALQALDDHCQATGCRLAGLTRQIVRVERPACYLAPHLVLP